MRRLPIGAGVWAPAAAACLIALAARAVHLFDHPGIPDEAFTLSVASQPLPQMLAFLRTNDAHPPLFYALTHLLLGLGHHAYLLRLMPALFGLLGVASTYALARRCSLRNAWFAAALLALCPILVFFDQFVRMYAMLWSLSVLSWVLLLRGLDEPRSASRWGAYSVCAIVLVYTHYLAFFIVAAQCVYVLVQRPKAAAFWASIAVCCVALMPWAPFFVDQSRIAGGVFNGQIDVLRFLAYAPAALLVDGLPTSLEHGLALPLVLWLTLIAAVLTVRRERRPLVLWLFLPLLFQIAFSLLAGKTLIAMRYLLQYIPALCILLGALVDRLLKTRLRAAGFALALSMLLLAAAGTTDKLLLPAFQPVDWSRYGRFLGSLLVPGEPVVLDGGITYFILLSSGALRGHAIYLVNNPRSAAAVARVIGAKSRVCYVQYEVQYNDPAREVLQALRRTHSRERSWRSRPAAYDDVVFTSVFER